MHGSRQRWAEVSFGWVVSFFSNFYVDLCNWFFKKHFCLVFLGSFSFCSLLCIDFYGIWFDLLFLGGAFCKQLGEVSRHELGEMGRIFCCDVDWQMEKAQMEKVGSPFLTMAMAMVRK